MKLRTLLIALCLALLPSARGYVVVGFNVTTDGSASDTQAAIDFVDGLNADGYTIIIGTAGGSYTWATEVKMADTFTHSVTIQGAGDGASRANITSSWTGPYYQVRLFCSPNKLTKVQYINWAQTVHNMSGAFLVVQSATGSTTIVNGIWIQYCKFTDCGLFAVRILEADFGWQTIFGLINNCDFVESTNYNGIYVFAGNTSNQWSGSMGWGTVNTVCIEDCNFTNSGAIVPGNPAIDSAYNGARYLVRYSNFSNWVVVAHGSDSAPTSTQQTEMYYNTTTVSGGCDYAWYIRGGSTVAYNNTITYTGSGFYNSGFKLENDSSGSSYPYFQQVGQGSTAGVQFTQGSYFWNNTFNLNGGTSITTGGAHAADIQLNRDYFTVAPNGSTPLTSYTALQYPHPLRAGGITNATGLSGKVVIKGKLKIQ